MANPLQMAGGPPQAPEPQMPSNGLQQSQAPQQGAPQQQGPAPPTHEQTVAVLRHFDAVKNELIPLLKDPTLGKSDLKPKIIDGVTKLVGDRIISAATAVQQLSQVPTDPQQQRKYLQNMMTQTMQAENTVLDHYGQGNPSLAASPAEVDRDPGKRDDHMSHMDALHANYVGAK